MGTETSNGWREVLFHTSGAGGAGGSKTMPKEQAVDNAVRVCFIFSLNKKEKRRWGRGGAVRLERATLGTVGVNEV